MSKLQEVKESSSKPKTNISYTEKTTNGDTKPGMPKGAKELKRTVNTSTEQIENGYLITKSYDIEYETKNGEKGYTYYSKKWYSKEDPLEITLTDKSLAEAFKD